MHCNCGFWWTSHQILTALWQRVTGLQAHRTNMSLPSACCIMFPFFPALAAVRAGVGCGIWVMWHLATWSCTQPLGYTVLLLTTTVCLWRERFSLVLKNQQNWKFSLLFVWFSMFDVQVTFGCSGCSPPLHILITTTGDPQIFQLARRVLLKLSEFLVCRIVLRWFYNALGRNTNDVASQEAFQKALQ